MLRYVFLSVFALIFLTACGGSDTDSSSNDLDKVFENTTGARVDIDKESTTDGKTRKKTEEVVKLDAGPVNKKGDLIGKDVGPTGTGVGNDLDKLKETNACVGCDLTGADLSGANLGGVFGADFTGAINVP